jgi:O-antigen/teichoic acid export membrane protein
VAAEVAAVGLHGRRKFVVDVATTLGARFAAVPLALVSSILLARTLQPAGKGVYATVVTFADLSLVLGSLGISTAAVYYLAQSSEDVEQTRATVLGLCLVVGLAVSLGLVAVAAVSLVRGGGQGSWALAVVAPVGVISLGRAGLESFFRAQHRIRTINAAAVVSSLAFVLLIALAVLGPGLSATSAVALRVVSILAATVVLVVAARSTGVAVPRPRLHVPTARLLLAYGLPYAAYSIVQSFSNRFDYILLRVFGDASTVGIYSVAVGQAELLWILPTAVGFVLFPRVAALVRDDSERAARETAAVLRWNVLLTSAGALVLAVLATPLTRIVYGDAFVPAVTPLRILLVGIVASSFLQVLSSLLLGTGRLRLMILTTAGGFALNLGCNLVLIPRYGMKGAAASSAFSYTVTGLVLAFVAKRAVPELRRESLLPLPRAIAGDLRRAKGTVS